MSRRQRLTIYGIPRPEEQRCAGEHIPRHRHDAGHITIVLAGRYREDGDAGRLALEPGHVIVHRPFEAHSNHIGVRGCTLATFEAPLDLPEVSLFRLEDPDDVMRVSERDPREALERLMNGMAPAQTSELDWPDLLATELRKKPRLKIQHWAWRNRLARETVSRGFAKAFGVSPAQYRREAMTRAALQEIVSCRSHLSWIAADHGFADQAHLARSVRAVTGFTPTQWREASHPFKTALTADS